MKCFICKKGAMIGKQHKHHPGVAGGRWKKRAPVTQKIFKPNLHNARILINGAYKKVRLCTKCLRRVRQKEKELREKKSPPTVQPVQIVQTPAATQI